MTDLDFWEECISLGAEDCDLTLTPEQLKCLAESVSAGHENYGMAFYSPPNSDRYDDLECESQSKLKKLQAEFDAYRNNAESAVKQALGKFRDANVSIGDHGEVFLHDGRTEQIQ